MTFISKSRLSKAFASLAVLAGIALYTTAAAAQSFKTPQANNREIALTQGKQLVSAGNKCVRFGGGTTPGNNGQLPFLTLQDCNPTATDQRFKFVDGRLKTSSYTQVWESKLGPHDNSSHRWENACVTALTDGRLQGRMQAQRCGDWDARPDKGPISWSLVGREIRSGNVCLDVASTANGQPVLHSACQGKPSQQWTMK